MQRFPHFDLDNGKQIYFGQNLQEVEMLFTAAAIDNPSRIARKGIDKQIEVGGVSLEFDTGHLETIEFNVDYDFKNPPIFYADSWKNFEVIGKLRIKANMSRDEFTAYIAAWEIRAEKLGAEKTDSEDLKQNQYRISFDKDEFADMFHACMGPSRRAGGGGIWADGWTAFFATEREAELYHVPVGKMRFLSAFCDEFNSVARR